MDAEIAAEPLTDAETRRISVPGKPVTWKRTGFNPTTRERYTTDNDRASRDVFTRAWLDAGHPAFERGMPLAMEAVFVFSRPAGHFGTGRNSDLLKPQFAEARPGAGKNGGDLDNLVKLVKDALGGVAFFNDAQIAELTASKRYAAAGEIPHSEIGIRAL